MGATGNHQEKVYGTQDNCGVPWLTMADQETRNHAGHRADSEKGSPLQPNSSHSEVGSGMTWRCLNALGFTLRKLNLIAFSPGQLHCRSRYRYNDSSISEEVHTQPYAVVGARDHGVEVHDASKSSTVVLVVLRDAKIVLGILLVIVLTVLAGIKSMFMVASSCWGTSSFQDVRRFATLDNSQFKMVNVGLNLQDSVDFLVGGEEETYGLQI
ncbi:hypothetical protein BDZ89DRAFT_1050313 [Hymenopellis radicata]|nr:hypothetical protein BDZ89DRAFT_1050313 [Hymenopellis radicata]